MSTDSETQYDPEARIWKIMTVFYPALICPAEMWWQVLEALAPPERIDATLASLSPKLKANIRDYYRSMKPTYYADYLAQPHHDERRALLCSKFIEWCERESDASGV